MAFSLFYITRNTLKKTHLPFTIPFLLLSPSSSSRFSTLCKKNPNFCSNPQSPPQSPPPVPKKVPFNVSVHGVKWQDDYHWMSNINDPDFINYLDEENVYADGFMKDTEQIQTTLYSEMVSRMPSKVSTPPELWGSWLYSEYIPEGKEYPVLCRKLIHDRKNWMDKAFNYLKKEHGKVQTLLDWNAIAQQYGYVHVGTCRVSPDHNFLAYTIDTTGNENFCLKIKNIQEDRQLLDHQIEGVVSVAWAHDGRTVFYTSCDQNQRPCSVNCIKLDSEFVDPTPLFVENDPRFCVDIASTKDNKYITVNSNSRKSSEVYVIDVVNTQCKIQRFCKRVSGVQYFLEHHDGYFYILTNAPLTGYDEIEGYYLARCRVEDFASTNCQTLILPSEDICLLDMDIFNEHLVLHLNKEGSSSICSISLSSFDIHKKSMKIDGFDPWYFPVPSDLCTVVPGSNHDFTSSIYRVVVSSPVMPDVVLDYHMSRKTYSIVNQEEVVTNNGVDSMNKNEPNDLLKRIREFSDTYCCEKKTAYSNDGTMVPLTILYSRKFPLRNQSPGILHGYGAYGDALDKSWCSDFLSLLDRGWVIAFADVRGGAGPEPSWHSSGSGMNKLNSIYDYISCGKYLIDNGYVHEEQLAAIARSAGGLLVGAAINMQPRLFRASILQVPFLDICNTMLNPDFGLTISDYEEFGNPENESDFRNIMEYSPYDNIPRGLCCPATLVTTAFNDSRVGVWEAAKWVARIRDIACPSCSSSVILRSSMDGGHFSTGGRYSHCKEVAYEYAFLMKVMGIADDLQQ